MNVNATRHKENSKYAHYSRINRHNYENYNLKKTNPISISMKKGDCLFIPKGWWHWIVSKPNTKAYNIWFDENINIKKPLILSEKINSKITNNLLIDLLQNKKVVVYNENENTEFESTVKDYIESNIEYTYIITLNDIYSHNRFIIDLLEKYLQIPKILNNNNIIIDKKNINFWFNINIMDTGLHYDDDNGILCMIDGVKDVLLFPPEDTFLLDSYKNIPLWIHNKIENLLYNTYGIRNNIIPTNKIHNNNLLLRSFTHPEIVRYINNLCGIFGQNNLVYGVKCDINGNIRYEIYFYIFDKYNSNISNDINKLKNVYSELSTEIFEPIKNINITNINENKLTIHSFDLYHENDKIIFNKTDEKPKISLYYNLDPYNNIEIPFNGILVDYDGYNFTNKSLFIVAKTEMVIHNIKNILNNIKLNIHPDIILNLIDEYNYVETISIYNKGYINKKQLFCIQFFGLADNDFYNFLIKYNYPKLLINFYKQNYKKLDYSNKEITIHYEFEDNKIRVLRTAFYGSI
jgi:hypothetical protein